jgi:hypothetical protein
LTCRGKYIPLNRGETKQAHTVVEHNSGSIVQTHTGLHELSLAADNSEMIIAGAEDVSHLEEVCQDGSRLECLEGVLDDIGPLAKKSDEVRSVLLSQKAEVGSCQVIIGELSSSANRAQTSVSVLEIRTSITLERGHNVHIKLVVVDSSAISGSFLHEFL